jgi:hypothetical protein
VEELRVVCCNRERLTFAEASLTYQFRTNLSVIKGVIATFHFEAEHGDPPRLEDYRYREVQ